MQLPERYKQQIAVRNPVLHCSEWMSYINTSLVCSADICGEKKSVKAAKEHCCERVASQQGELASVLAREEAPLGTGSFFFTIRKPVLCKIV